MPWSSKRNALGPRGEAQTWTHGPMGIPWAGHWKVYRPDPPRWGPERCLKVVGGGGEAEGHASGAQQMRGGADPRVLQGWAGVGGGGADQTGLP